MDDINDFLNKYEAQASLSDRRHYAKRMPMSMSEYHRYHTAMDVYEAESYIHREPYVEMYIPQHKFQEMVERDRYYRQVSEQVDHATEVIKEQIREDAIRRKNPAVEKAYQRYKMLLEVCRK